MFRVALRNEGQKGQRDRKCRAGMAMPEQLQTCLLIWQHAAFREGLGSEKVVVAKVTGRPGQARRRSPAPLSPGAQPQNAERGA